MVGPTTTSPTSPNGASTSSPPTTSAPRHSPSFYALCVIDDKAELEHMWVQTAYIGTGIGKDLFLDAMERAAKMNVSEVELSADPNAAGFYERMGATRIGDVDSEIDGKPRKLPRMKVDVRTADRLAHLKQFRHLVEL